MKKAILLLSPVFLIVQLAIAQKPDAAIALVRYTLSHIRDTTNRAKVYTENMELLLGKNASVYRSEDQRLHDENMRKILAERAKTGTTGMGNFAGVGGPHGSTTKIYQYQAEKKLIRQEKIINIYFMDEALPVINWKITADTTSLGSLHCQKATAVFKGRIYEAWFCPTLPFHSGPWKLNGLPGLILEASDSKKEVVWKFAGLEDVNKIEESNPVANAGSTPSIRSENPLLVRETYSLKTIELPKDGLKTTEKEYTRLNDAFHKDPQGFTNTSLAASGSSTRIYLNMSSNWGKNPINNPIELTNKP